MSQSGYTPILSYSSATASAVPLAANLSQGELAVNTNDGKLFYKDSSGVVQTMASKATGAIGGSNTQVQFNNSGVLGGSANLTFNGTTLTAAGLAGPHNGTVGATTPATGAFTSLTSSSDATLNGLTVGRGAGAVSTNTAVGSSVLAANNTGARNTAIGYNSLLANQTGGLNTAVGEGSLKNNTASDNTAVGVNSLLANTSGTGNTALGRSSASSNTTGSALVAIGYAALDANTTGSNNTALGTSALQSNTTASNNTAVGYQAGYSAVTADYNTFIGYYAGRSTTGDQNTFIGKFAGNAVTTGTLNTIIGAYNGNQGGLDIRTASNYIVLSDGGGTPRATWNATGVLSQNSSILELATVTAAAPSSTQNFDASTQAVQYFTTNAANNWTLNVRGNSSTTLNSVMAVGQSLSLTVLTTQGATAYYNSAVTIDGTSVTPKWQGGTAPTSGNASSIDSYTYVILKTGSAAFTVLASVTKFA